MMSRIPPPEPMRVVTVVRSPVPWSPGLHVEIHQGERSFVSGVSWPLQLPVAKVCAAVSTVGRAVGPDAAGMPLGGVPAPWGGWQHAFGIVLRNETHV